MSEMETACADPSDAKFRVTLQIRAKHADLWAAAKAKGGIKAMAEFLGISQPLLGSWIAMRSAPQWKNPHAASLWHDEKRRLELEAKLFEMTGKTLDELWPDAMRDQDFLEMPKTIEITQDADVRGLALYQAELRALPSPHDSAERVERAERLSDVLRTLTCREREIVKLRFGLGGADALTLAECGKIFKVSNHRVRQIEEKAIRKMRHPRRVIMLGYTE